MEVCPRDPSPERYFILDVENWVVFEFFLSLNRPVTPWFTSLFKNLSYFYSAGYLPGVHSSRDQHQLIKYLFALRIGD